jgi:prophage endopeptidase
MIKLLKFIPTPYLILAISLAVLASHGAAAWGGWKLRDNSARAAAQKEAERKVQELTAMNAEIIRMQREVRAAEAEHASRLASFSQTYQERLQNVRDEKDKFIADVRSGAIRLRIPAQTNAVPSGSAQTIPTASRCDAAAGSELPAEVAEFLWSEAGRADEITHQLTAAQETISEYMRLCGAK